MERPKIPHPMMMTCFSCDWAKVMVVVECSVFGSGNVGTRSIVISKAADVAVYGESILKYLKRGEMLTFAC